MANLTATLYITSKTKVGRNDGLHVDCHDSSSDFAGAHESKTPNIGCK